MTTTAQNAQQLHDLTALRDFHQALAGVLDLNTLLRQMTVQVAATLGAERVLVFVSDDEDLVLKFGAINLPTGTASVDINLRNLTISLYGAAAESVVGAWAAGNMVVLDEQ